MPAVDAQPSRAMINALVADGPYAEYADKLSLFGRLVGSWDLEGTYFDREGHATKQQIGEWHFGWVLEGRVIQDVIISPPRAGRQPGERSFEYGTTLRVYDPKLNAWRVTFVAPVFGATVNLVATRHDDEIWLDGESPAGILLRWTFSDITDARVVWQGFESDDKGLHWTRTERILLTRMRDSNGRKKKA